MDVPRVKPTGRAHVRAAMFPIAVTLVWTLIYAFAPMAVVLVTLLAVPMIVIWAAVAVFCIASASVRGDWRRSAAASTAFLVAWPIMGVTMASADYIHLGLMYPLYMAKIQGASDQEQTLIVANWGSIGSAMSGYSDRILVYDGRDEITAKSQVQPLSSEPAVKVYTDRLLSRFYIRQYFWD